MLQKIFILSAVLSYNFYMIAIPLQTTNIIQPYIALHTAGTYIAVHKNSQFFVTQSLQFLSMVKIFRGELISNNVVQKQVFHVAVNSGESICRKKYGKNK